MKQRFTRILFGTAIVATGVFSSCDLDEGINYSAVDLEVAFTESSNYQGLLNSCYENIYTLYGKLDGIAPMEMGTDLWTTETTETGLSWYGTDLTTSASTLQKFWNALYGTVNLCNTAIYYADVVEDMSESDKEIKLGEAYFLRAWANFNIVEQWGNCVLNMNCVAVDGIPTTATRSTEEEFYDLIISDLNYAKEHLPYEQTEIGRATKKAAYALLAKVYLQRTRLGDEEEYSRLALETAQELINNQDTYNCALYTSDATTSGFEKLWDDANNKDNTEWLFVEYVDHEGGMNPESWNRGRTMQKYLFNENLANTWGVETRSFRYGRGNDRGWKPTLYCLTSIFEPVEDPADTRYATTFFYKIYATNDKEITSDMCTNYDKDPSLAGHVISGTAVAQNSTEAADLNYYSAIGWGSSSRYIEEVINMDNDEGLALFFPNWTIPEEEKRMMPCFVSDPSDMFQADGTYVTDDAYRYQLHPAMKKFSPTYYMYNNAQYNMGNFPILRLGDIYLVAAEAAIRLNQTSVALNYVQTIRDRAAVTGRTSEMQVSESDMTLDFITAERGRELAGEQWRWYDLKRLGKLNHSYLSETNPDTNFEDGKNEVRPIPQSFLDQIANAAEFGTNGY